MPEKMFSGIKSDFSEFCSIPGHKYRIAMTHSLLERNFCDFISLKVEKPIASNFAHLLVPSVPLLVLISNRPVNCNHVFWVRAKAPPPQAVAGEISKCHRL